jgi:hypothetical protein
MTIRGIFILPAPFYDITYMSAAKKVYSYD